MARESSLDQEALKFAEAIHKYAASKGWKADDYHIFMTVNTDLITLNINVVAKAFEGRTEQQEFDDYDDVMDLIESEVKPSEQAFNSYGLVLSGRDGFTFSPSPYLGPAEVEIDEKVINHGESWSEPFRPQAQ
jgi:hypothetical protein